MAESVKQYGVLVPALVRPKRSGGYEMVAGHRRKTAADLAGLAEILALCETLTDEEATIIMVDSNLQREQILPSEKAFAYKMKLDAMKRQAGRPSKENSRPVGADLIGTRSDELLAKDVPDSARQIQRYIRLTNLVPEILELVDNSVLKDRKCCKSRCGLRWSFPTCEKRNKPTCFPSWTRWTVPRHTPRPSKCVRCPKPRLERNGCPKDAMTVIMEEEKGNQKRTVQNPKGTDQQIFCAGDARAEDRGHHYQGSGAVPQAPAQFRTITPLTRGKCAHFTGKRRLLPVPPLHTLTPFRQPKQPKKEDISRALDDRKLWQASFPQTCGAV